MANTIQIKRSTTTATPTTLAVGEMAFSELSGNLFIGGTGNSILNIGGVLGVTVQPYSAALAGTTASFTSAQQTKLAGIEAGANVTDAANVAASGAVMDGDFNSNGLMKRTAAGTYSVVSDSSGNWNTAYGWGDHSIVGYALASNLAAVATSGSYNDLTNKPDLSALAEISYHTSQANFPGTGDTSKVYIAQDTGYMYRWNGSSYVQMSDQTAIWGQISGTLSNQTDLQNALNAKLNASSYTAADVKSKYESNSNTNAYTDAEKTKLAGIASGATANTGTVTSVALAVPTGFTVSGTPVTSSGTLTLGFASGYALTTTSQHSNWNSAYSWGNHATAGYLTASSTIDGGTF